MKNPQTNGNDNRFEGTPDDDIIHGKDGDDRLEGNKGNDTIYGGKGDDFIQGGDGKDTVVGGHGNDQLFGGRGEDVLSDRYGVNLVDGGHGKDVFMLAGRQEDYNFEMLVDGSVVVTRKDLPADKFQTTLKNIEVIRFQNEDLDHDYHDGPLPDENPNTDVLLKDVIQGPHQNVEGLEGVEKGVEVEGETYDFHYHTSNDDSYIRGGAHNQFSTDTNYFIQGADGNDTLSGNDGDDRLQGGKGNDFLAGGGGDDIIKGGVGNDTVEGGAGDDEIEGGKGNDYLRGGQGNDTIHGDSGNDDIVGGAGKDTLYGGEGADHLWGEDGDDYLGGGEGVDKLYGGDGNDWLRDELGVGNRIDGGDGKDTYVLTGSMDDYTFTRGEDGSIIVSGNNFENNQPFETTLTNIEQVYFLDGALGSDPDSYDPADAVNIGELFSV